MTVDFAIRNDSQLYARQPTAQDPGVAVYLLRAGKQVVMARDAFSRPEHKLVSLALAVEGLRQLERHGGGTMLERAFEGFTALPAPAAVVDCWTVLGLPRGADEATIRTTYRRLAKLRHPSAGGSEAAMTALNVARDEALSR